MDRNLVISGKINVRELQHSISANESHEVAYAVSVIEFNRFAVNNGYMILCQIDFGLHIIYGCISINLIGSNFLGGDFFSSNFFGDDFFSGDFFSGDFFSGNFFGDDFVSGRFLDTFLRRCFGRRFGGSLGRISDTCAACGSIRTDRVLCTCYDSQNQCKCQQCD